MLPVLQQLGLAPAYEFCFLYIFFINRIKYNRLVVAAPLASSSSRIRQFVDVVRVIVGATRRGGQTTQPCAGLRSASAAAAAASRLSLIPTELDSRRVQFLLSVTRHFSFVYALSLPHAAHFIHARTLRQYSALEVKSKGRPVDPDGPVLISGGSMWAAMGAIAPPPLKRGQKNILTLVKRNPETGS